MAKNVHIEEVSKVRLPSVVTSEDRGLRFCKTPIRAVATLDSVDLEKNSRLGLAYRFDTIVVTLERQRDGAEIAAPGIAVSFPHQSDATGFVIDWRQLTRDDGMGGDELDQGCYRVKIGWTLGIAAGFFYECSVELLEYNDMNTEGYVNMYVVLNDLVINQGIGINYKDSGFATTLMFKGQFGYMQPNYLTTNNIYSPDNDRRKVRILPVRTYELRTNFLLSCVTQKIDEKYLLAANQIYITDWNANNHERERYVNFPVILSEEESPSFKYDTSIYARVNAIFKDKQQLYESKYSGDIKGSDNIILELPTLIGGAAPVTPSATSTMLNKSGQTTSYRTGDDGDTQRGRGTDFLILSNNNPYGNTTRFLDELGGTAFANDIVIDWSHRDYDAGTVLGYYRVDRLALNWNDAIDTSLALSVGSFTTGWYLPNVPEMENLKRFQGNTGNNPLDYAPFNISATVNFWTSQTRLATTTSAHVLLNNSGYTDGVIAKTTATARHIYARIFTLAELGL